jgi:hypothetical protein
MNTSDTPTAHPGSENALLPNGNPLAGWLVDI